MNTGKHSEQGHNSAMDKTDAQAASGDPYANQGGGKLGSGNENSGHPANNVIATNTGKDVNPAQPAGGSAAKPAAPAGANGDRGSKGSGMPALTGAGQLADDRPGRNDPKSGH